MNTKNQAITLLTGALLSSSLLASDLDVSMTSTGASSVQVAPGATVDYTITGELSDGLNEGLAFFTFDVTFDGGDLAQADAPTSNPMLNFVSPVGFSNPAGWGGAVTNGDLIQVGGGQNTIKNSFAPQPIGTVMTGVAAPGSPATLLTGSLTAPATPGSYTLTIQNPMVNVIRQGEDGSGDLWAVDAADLGALVELEIEVLDCTPSTYCTAKVTGQGCTPSLSSTGSPTLTGADNFAVVASDVTSGGHGAVFWGLAPDSLPFMGGTNCVAPPQARLNVQPTGGPFPFDCSGVMTTPITQARMLQNGWGVGTTVYAQAYFRDPEDAFGIGLTDGIEFTICP